VLVLLLEVFGEIEGVLWTCGGMCVLGRSGFIAGFLSTTSSRGAVLMKRWSC
jgi:hypothetical protein